MNYEFNLLTVRLASFLPASCTLWLFVGGAIYMTAGQAVQAQYSPYESTGGDRSYNGYNQPQVDYQQRANQPAQTLKGGRVNQWFSQYDQIRRQAQMSPRERQQADYFLSKITAVFVPGQEKLAAKELLTRMVVSYRQAASAMKQLPMFPETAELHRGYYRYFVTAGNLFIDYVKVQDNLLAVDPQTGQPLAAQLLQRKLALEQLTQNIQSLDQPVRYQYGIPDYRY